MAWTEQLVDGFRGRYRWSGRILTVPERFSSHEEALAAALSHEALINAEVQPSLTVQGFASTFLRIHDVSATTKGGYRVHLNRRILPHLGHLRLVDLRAPGIKHFMTSLKEAGVSPSTRRGTRATLSALLQEAVEMGLIDSNPARQIKAPRVPRQSIKVLNPEQAQRLLAALPTPGARSFAYLCLSTGIRPGESYALRTTDLVGDVLHIARRITNQPSDLDDEGKSRAERPGTKTGEGRRLKVGPEAVRVWNDHVAAYGLQEGDLMWTNQTVARHPNAPLVRTTHAKGRPPLTPERIQSLGIVKASNGHTYQHGTVNAYVTARCRCEWCRQAMTEYSNRRRALRNGWSQGTKRSAPAHSDPYLGNRAWGTIWRKALLEAGLPQDLKPRQMRHTHVSWLVANGVDVKEAQERLGHASLSMTSVYVAVVDQDRSAGVMEGLLRAPLGDF